MTPSYTDIHGTWLTINWADGVLQHADSPAGPFEDVPFAVPPSFMVHATNGSKFYRLRNE